ncbi:alkaline phosphatase [Knoellia remsis]|uniref:Alkaline phosphatase n=1 Tax=Knoellia remsis TaxID=407159 RepID=A0A2T0UZI2_9MICO|nr:alkaline phosphatase [Knoellia remsis]PRY63343.1 alkaline phosphatase [Knoellia remsis]
MTPLIRSSRRTTLALATVSALAITGTAAYAASGLAATGGATRLSGDQTAAVKKAIDGGKARNVILLIGDGMGDSEITSARYYEYGAAGRLPGIDALPLTGQYTTYSLYKDGKPDYAPDSAATGTAWATGTKTYDNAVSVDIEGKPLPTLLKLAKERGLKTGNVTTSDIQDATPAVQVANISQRSCFGPEKTSTTCPEAALENGGPGSITEQLLTTRPDVTLGGGAKTFAEKAKAGEYAGQTLAQQATARGYRTVTDVAGLEAVTEANQDTPLLGLFAPGNLPVRYTGPKATPTGGALPPVKCTANPERPSTQPTLAQMTTKAIELLDTPAAQSEGKGNGKAKGHDKGKAKGKAKGHDKANAQAKGDKGFFLQVEGASIDKQDHAANACGQIGEAIDLDEAVQAALEFAKKDGNTTVIVTADHAHTSQIVEGGSTTPGLTANLLTKDGSPLTIAYGTGAAGDSQQHTGSQLRVAGYGPQAANVVGLTDQTDMFFTISRALGLGER